MFDDDLGLDDGDRNLEGGDVSESRIQRSNAGYISSVRRKPLVDGVDGMVFENQPPPGPGRLSLGQTDYSALYMILGIEVPSDPRIHPIRAVKGDSDK